MQVCECRYCVWESITQVGNYKEIIYEWMSAASARSGRIDFVIFD